MPGEELNEKSLFDLLLIGGVGAFLAAIFQAIRAVRRHYEEEWDWKRFIVGIVSASAAGAIMAWALDACHVSREISAVVIAMSGYVGGRLLDMLETEIPETVQAGFALKFWRALKKGDADLAMREMQSYMAEIPYVEGFKQKLAEAATAEGFYEYTLYLIFSMLNVYVRTQVKVAGGRVDMVVWMPDTTYVFELKVNGTAQQALAQIDQNGYAIPYQTDGRRVVKVGVKFNPDTRVPEEWVIAE